jgi:ribonuclease P protein component
VRNRARRRLREVYRLHAAELQQGYDIILVGRSHTADAKWTDLEQGFLRLCRKLSLLREDV